jgi:hypothetical protein
MTPQDKQEAAGQFYSRLMDFGNRLERNEPFTWEIKSDELNDILASLDEIAEKAQEGKAREVRAVMDRIGIDEPVVALNEGVMTVMVRSARFNKVLSGDVRVAFTPEGRLSARMAGARVGRLPLPLDATRGWLGTLKEALGRRLAESKTPATAPKVAGMSSEDVAGILGGIVSVIDGEPISPEFTWPVNHIRVRVEDIQIHKGSMTLKVRPSRR